MLAIPVAERAAQYEAPGMAPGVAGTVAAAADEAMGRCILALYRSAAQSAMARLGEQLGNAAARPGLVIIPTEDSYTGGERRARQAAEKAATKVAALPGLGHWWMLQDPRAGASGPARVLVDSEGVSLGRFPSLAPEPPGMAAVCCLARQWPRSGPGCPGRTEANSAAGASRGVGLRGAGEPWG
jgi:hypothetical protein